MPGKAVLPYGTWPSPISARHLSQGLRLEDAQWDSDNSTLVWLEGRSGRGVLVTQTGLEAPQDLDAEIDVQGGVGYGGGDFSVSKGQVYFAAKDGRLFCHRPGIGRPRAVTPPFGSTASPCPSPDGHWLLYIFSDGNEDVLALVDSSGADWPVKLSRGADFYMQPAWHPGGEWITWVEWDHPNMPWDGARLQLGRLVGSPPHLEEVKLVAGDAQTPVCQPLFSPDGRWLSYIVSNGEWEDLVTYDLANGEKRVLINGQGFHLCEPAWIQGTRFYGWSGDSQSIYHIRSFGGRNNLWKYELESEVATQLNISPYTWIEQISVAPSGEKISFTGKAPSVPKQVVSWERGTINVVARSTAHTIPADFLPEPQSISWTASGREIIYGHFTPPCHPKFTGEGLPPAIVKIHGGPTSQDPVGYEAEKAYFTSRGWGWLEVDYRGSSGYGRSYRQALNGGWGIVDVEGAAGAAGALIKKGLANGHKLAIYGGSAGGFTVLNTLISYPGLYKAGVCCYGISNLFTLAADTHKFEQHYLEKLIGQFPSAADSYQARSPVFHADKITDPLAIFQGSNDRVVPPSQSEEIVKRLSEHQIPHIYRLYEGEGHGFRKQKTIADFITRMDQFLQQMVLASF